jgi:ABC-type uncharacterized transport system substrate-binding protein
MAAELVRRQAAVIVANGLAVPFLSRPGGNATGVVFTQTDLATKQLGLLHELAPNAAVIAVLGDPNQPELKRSRTPLRVGTSSLCRPGSASPSR